MSDTSKTAKIIKRWYHSPSRRLTVNVLLNNITFLWVGRSVNKKRYIYQRKIFVIFHPFAEKPPTDGFAPNFAWGSSRRRNHLFRILCRSVEGFRMCAGSNFAILPLLSQSPLTQGCATARLWYMIWWMICTGTLTRKLHTNWKEIQMFWKK